MGVKIPLLGVGVRVPCKVVCDETMRGRGARPSITIHDPS